MIVENIWQKERIKSCEWVENVKWNEWENLRYLYTHILGFFNKKIHQRKIWKQKAEGQLFIIYLEKKGILYTFKTIKREVTKKG